MTPEEQMLKIKRQNYWDDMATEFINIIDEIYKKKSIDFISRQRMERFANRLREEGNS